MKFALIKDNFVVSIVEAADAEEIGLLISQYQNAIDITSLDPLPAVGWELVGTILTDPTGLSQPSKKISKLKMLERFTDAEMAGIEAFAAQQNAYAYALRGAMRKQSVAAYIDLALPQTIAGINNLVALGLLTSDRANTILNSPVTATEKYKGIE